MIYIIKKVIMYEILFIIIFLSKIQYAKVPFEKIIENQKLKKICEEQATKIDEKNSEIEALNKIKIKNENEIKNLKKDNQILKNKIIDLEKNIQTINDILLKKAKVDKTKICNTFFTDGLTEKDTKYNQKSNKEDEIELVM